MAGLQTSVRYMSDGTSAVWHVPFPYASPTDVGVKQIAADGMEKTLTQGTDYVLNGSAVMCVVPAGCSICIWLNASIDSAMTAVRTAMLAPQTMAAAPAVSTYDMTQATQAADTELAQALARIADSLDAQAQRQAEAEAAAQARLSAEADAMAVRAQETATASAVAAVAAEAETQRAALQLAGEALTSGLRSEADAAQRAAGDAMALAKQAAARLDDSTAAMNAAAVSLTATSSRTRSDVESAGTAATQAVRQAQATALAQIGAATDAARQRAATYTALSSGTSNAEALLVLDAPLSSGDEVHLPGGLSYYPGRGMLMAFYQGCALALGHNFDEVGAGGQFSDRVRLLFNAQEGDELLFRVIATNSSADAADAAARAERAAVEAAGSAADAKASAASAEAAEKRIEDAAWYAEQWADNAATSAEQSYGSAQCAWDAAYQASIAAHANRPGIAAFATSSDLDGALSGAYFLNPFVRHSPTYFMGMWPVESSTDAVWDGFFFVGTPYPDTPIPPPMPICTEKPQTPDDPVRPPSDGGSSGNDGTTAVWGPCRG